MAIFVLAVVFLFHNLREKKCPWLNSQVLHVLKILEEHLLKIAALDHKKYLKLLSNQ